MAALRRLQQAYSGEANAYTKDILEEAKFKNQASMSLSNAQSEQDRIHTLYLTIVKQFKDEIKPGTNSPQSRRAFKILEAIGNEFQLAKDRVEEIRKRNTSRNRRNYAPVTPPANTRRNGRLQAPTCFADPDRTKNTKNRYLCDKQFTRRIVSEGGELDSIYATNKVIGEGSYGSVMNAEINFHTSSGKYKCVGVYKVSKSESTTLDRDTITEVACYARLLNTPCVSKGIFIKLASGNNKTVMENYLTDLDFIFDEEKKIIPAGADRNMLVKAIAFQMLTGLHGMHKEHIIHRDIKPGNTFIAHDGEVVIGDFGGCHNTQIGFNNRNGFYQRITTLVYEAPEGHKGQRGPKNDVWAIGVCIYEFLSMMYFISNEFYDTYLKNDDIKRFDSDRLYTSLVNAVMIAGIDADAKSLIGSMLTLDPTRRPSAELCLKHKWFNGMSIESAQKTVVRSLSGFCLQHAKTKVNSTLKNTNVGGIRNNASNTFMRIHEGPAWAMPHDKRRNDGVIALFNLMVARSKELKFTEHPTGMPAFPLLKFLHTVELFDRLVKLDPSVLNNPTYIFSCSVIADLLSEDLAVSNDGSVVTRPTRRSPITAVILSEILRKTVSVEDVEEIMRTIIRLLGGDLFILPNGLVTHVAEAKPRTVKAFFDAVAKVAGVELRADPGVMEPLLDRFVKSYL